MRIDRTSTVPIGSQYVDEAWKRLAAIAQHQQQAQRELLKGLLNQVETDAALPIEEKRKIQCSIVNEALQVELDFHIKAQNFQRGWITHLMKLPRKTDTDGMAAMKVSPPVDPTPVEQVYQPIRTPLPLPHRHPLLVPKTPGADEEEAVPRADADDAKTLVRPLPGEAPRRKKSRLQGPNSHDSVPVITLAESGSEGDAESPVIHHCEHKFPPLFHQLPSNFRPPTMPFPSFNMMQPSVTIAPFPHHHMNQMPQMMYPFAPQTPQPFTAFPARPTRAFSVAPVRRCPPPRQPMHPMADHLMRETPIGVGGGAGMETLCKCAVQGQTLLEGEPPATTHQ